VLAFIGFRFPQRLLPFASVLALASLWILVTPGLASPRHSGHVATSPDAEESAPSAEGSRLNAPYATACVLEPTTGTVIFDKDMHKPWLTASLTKMMLMLIVAEKVNDGSLKLTDQITTSHNAAKMGGSQVYLKEGETFPLEDMMKAIIVHSANDSSVAVAEYIAGSTDAFVQMMNKRAEELGLKDTHYFSVHGLPPAAGQTADVSSAYDLAILARELIKYPDIMRWSAIDTAPFRNGTFELRNTNHLVRTFRGCDGLKTGYYAGAGFNVVATAKRGGMRLIAVVLGSPRKLQNFNEAATLMSQGFLNYELYSVGKKGQPVPQPVAVTAGSAANFKPVWDSDVAVFLKRGQEKNGIKVSYRLPASIAAPIKAGQPVGEADVTLGGKTAATGSLIAPQDIEKASLLAHLLGRS
jgi:serine-type D-Ala-D-Ala carboxypeptidase (penicillin-binding protein 5/6)